MTPLIARDELRSVLECVTVVDALPAAPYGSRKVSAEGCSWSSTARPGDVALLVVSVHERGTLRQTWLGEDPA